MLATTTSPITAMQIIGHWHQIFWYFPMALYVAAMISDLLNFWGKQKAFRVGHWLIIAALISCIPTMLTGEAAAANFHPSDQILMKHRSLGYTTLISGSLYAGLRISALLWKLPLQPSHYLGLSFIMVALVAWTSDYGALITLGTLKQ